MTWILTWNSISKNYSGMHPNFFGSFVPAGISPLGRVAFLSLSPDRLVSSWFFLTELAVLRSGMLRRCEMERRFWRAAARVKAGLFCRRWPRSTRGSTTIPLMSRCFAIGFDLASVLFRVISHSTWWGDFLCCVPIRWWDCYHFS